MICSFRPDEAVHIGGLSVKAFTKSHDAADPHSFIVSFKKLKVGIFTDIGVACNQVKKYFKQCHAAFLEANYCADMLEKGGYPYHLKKRISSDKGHLSNTQALDLFINHRGDHLSHLFLSHLSKNNNSVELVNDLFSRQAGTIKITVASRYQETPLFTIDGAVPVLKAANRKYTRSANLQLSLFQ